MLKKTLSVLVCLMVLAACGDEEGVADAKSAEAAYMGIDGAIEKALNLGFAGFNAATSANIPAQSGVGDVSGTMEVTGQADSGMSANKGMRLYVAMVEYSDGPVTVDETEFAITYDTDPADLPYLEAKFANYPNGTFTGSYTGTVNMSGDLKGVVTLELTFAGNTEEDPLDATKVLRVEGTTTVTGTASSSYGTFQIDLLI
jgi:hypothetical protein